MSRRSKGFPERTVPMEVLNLSMPRTGSLSIKHALSVLGINCYHGVNLADNNTDKWFFLEAARAKVEQKSLKYSHREWDQVLANFGGVSDNPCIAFTDELIAAYPHAKVILVKRDVESWAESFLEILKDWRGDWKFTCLSRYDRWVFGPLDELLTLSLQILFGGSSTVYLEKTAKLKYKEHYQHVKAITPPEQLLEYRLGSGWEPLCTFLGKPVPKEPFPRVNDRQSFLKSTRWIRWLYVALLTSTGALAASIPIIFGWWMY